MKNQTNNLVGLYIKALSSKQHGFLVSCADLLFIFLTGLSTAQAGEYCKVKVRNYISEI